MCRASVRNSMTAAVPWSGEVGVFLPARLFDPGRIKISDSCGITGSVSQYATRNEVVSSIDNIRERLTGFRNALLGHFDEGDES